MSKHADLSSGDLIEWFRTSSSLDPDEIAQELSVTGATVRRWLKGDGNPSPTNEGKLRKLRSNLLSQRESSDGQQALFQGSPELGASIDKALKELREIYHRRGRFASQNEVVDEVSKLLFSHVAPILAKEGEGINRSILRSSASSAVALRRYVHSTFSNEIDAGDTNAELSEFDLRLDDDEDLMAEEIIECISSSIDVNTVAENKDNDIINEVFGKFLSDSFVDEKELGQYLTPPEVVKFMVDASFEFMEEKNLNKIREGNMEDFGYILDPSCGAASFLAEFVKSTHNIASLSSGNISDQREWYEAMLKHTIGVDKSRRMVRLAFINMALFGHEKPNIFMGNSLSRGANSVVNRIDGDVGLILTNPPFGAEFDSKKLSEYDLVSDWTNTNPKTIDSELLFLERYTEWLRPGGLILTILPDNALMNVGVHRDVRDSLSDYMSLEAVVSLPKETFEAAGTQTRTSVIVARKKGDISSKNTYFSVCEDIGYTVSTQDSQKYKEYNGQNELEKIYEEIEGSADIEIGRKIESGENENRWDAGYHAGLPNQILNVLDNKKGNGVCVDNVAELVDERKNPKRRKEDKFNYIQISDINTETTFASSSTKDASNPPSRARKLVHGGDVLISTVRPKKKNICVVRPEQDGYICTTGLAVLCPQDIDSLFLATLLKTDFVTAQLERLSGGASYPSFKEASLLDILLPLDEETVSCFQSESEKIMTLDKKLRETRDNLETGVQSVVDGWIAENE